MYLSREGKRGLDPLRGCDVGWRRRNRSVNQRVSRYVGHLAEGALRFRNELSVGTEAPDFELPALDGGAFRLSDYRGRSNVVLIFGSFTCASTVTQLRAGNPSLGELYRRFKRKGFRVFSDLQR